MEEKIKQLYEDINFIGFYCTYHKEGTYIEKAQKLIPQIEEFCRWFLEENKFGIEEDLYVALKRNLIDILNDCMQALKERDRVLMMDALEQGLVEYLRLFMPEECLEES
ncbi:MAG: hypothetical protein MR945_06400 [Agathobacter sp.]|nr:hypothetical protein [Agathobacter sp.]